MDPDAGLLGSGFEGKLHYSDFRLLSRLRGYACELSSWCVANPTFKKHGKPMQTALAQACMACTCASNIEARARLACQATMQMDYINFGGMSFSIPTGKSEHRVLAGDQRANM